MSETWLVCGGRDFDDELALFNALDRLCEQRGMPVLVVHGAARGADTMAGVWADRRGIACVAVQAEWEVYGRPAGPIRNARMLADHHPDLVIAFPGGRGTANMVGQALAAGVEVIAIPAAGDGS